jgi:FlaA1/EpsC-like NDP-sugar epimerase
MGRYDERFAGHDRAEARMIDRLEHRGPVARFIYHYRRPGIVVVHAALVLLSNFLAVYLHLKPSQSVLDFPRYLEMLPWLVAIRILVFIPFRLFEGMWRYTSVRDLLNIVAAVSISSSAYYVVLRWGLDAAVYPPSVYLLDSLLLIAFMGGIRLVRRTHRELARLVPDKRVLVYGAGDAGEMIVRDMRQSDLHRYEPMGFIDDNPDKVGRRIHGVKVLGTREALPAIMAEQKPDALIVAIPRARPATIREIVHVLEPYKVPIQTLPSLPDLIDGRVTVNQIRTLAVEDLLERVPLGLDVQPVRHLIAGKRVLITGAGGSIGSELARQVGALEPADVILLDRYENGVHALMTESLWQRARCRPRAVVGDVSDAARMVSVLAFHRPDIVLHAAAHKHVPLMESNACEAVRNNVGGTRAMLEAALRFGVERFILISTDKAVNASSVMGATKRVAELLVQSMGVNGTGIYSAVRFGNVLASNGSVVPQFLAQIAAGGPVTVTHPEMRRYFMLIPEAVHLVLQTATLAKGGDTFVLEMGEQIRVLDLARNLIRLSGFVPDEDIAIAFVGLRPGEKLSEELIGNDETADPTPAEGILRVQLSTPPEWHTFTRQVLELEKLAEAGDDTAVIAKLTLLVPTYRPWRSSE